MSSSKVFHVDESIHRLVTQYCKAHGVGVKEWVASTLKDVINGNIIVKNQVARIAPVHKIKLNEHVPDQHDPEIWIRPPFWTR